MQRTFTGLSLKHEPHYMDWSAVGTVHVFDVEIIPDSTYEVQSIRHGCKLGAEEDYSDPLEISTSKWGDVVKDCTTTPCGPPDGVVNIVDVTAVLDKYHNYTGNVIKARADVEGSPAGNPPLPDQVINITDVTFVQDAFLGFDYPFELVDYPFEECPGVAPVFNLNDPPDPNNPPIYPFTPLLPRSVWLEATDAVGQEFAITFTIHAPGARNHTAMPGGSDKADTAKAHLNECTPVTGKILAGAYIPKPWWEPDFNSSEKLTGAAGKITTRETKLCFERTDPPGNPQLAMSVAWVGVDERDSDEKNLRFAQVGYVRTYMYRHGSHKWYQKIAHRVYHEEGYWSSEDEELKYFRKFFNTDLDAPPDYSPPPSGEHLYICQLDKSSGTWRYFFDDDVIPFSLSHSGTHGYWEGGTGNVVTWNAEIYNLEDQMVGTSAERCEFSECRYYHDTQGRWIAPEFDESEHLDVMDKGHGSQWDVAKTGSNKIEVWDKDP